MQGSQEKLCLQWNDFCDNISSAFGDLRDDKEFTDVTLACEDGQQVEAHKVVLISSSPFFLNLLKRNKHPHPLVYMRGLKYEDLLSIMDFLYNGEVNVHQENLDSFLGMADKLQLKGLKKKKIEDVKTYPPILPLKSLKKQSAKLSVVTRDPVASSKDIFTKQKEEVKDGDLGSKTEKEAIEENSFQNIADLEELDQRVKSMMMFSKNLVDKQYGRARISKVCGKE